MAKIQSFLVAAFLSNFAFALPGPVPAATTPCWTSTTTVAGTGIANCPLAPATCPPTLDCIVLKPTTVTVPAPNTNCPITPTVTATAPPLCPTCQVGCHTQIVTVTVTVG
ncbi:hypothetical protein ACMFMG_005032 [Clarireedia jacksonii]